MKTSGKLVENDFFFDFFVVLMIRLCIFAKKRAMKRFLFTLVFAFVFLRSYAQPTIISPSFPSSVNLFDLFEVSFTMGDTYSNPYDPNVISIYALFVSPNNDTTKVEAFYFEDYAFQKIIDEGDYYEDVYDSLNNVGWRIRFTPTCVGNWKFWIKAKDSSGLWAQMPNYSLYYTFACTSINDGEGFISKANSRYLKRDVVKNGVRQFRSFFPIGPNVAWYNCAEYNTLTFAKPRGIYEYENYIDSLSGNANYMRIWLNRYQFLSLYGPEYTQLDGAGNPIVYFDSTINQKDSAELDYIISYAKQHGVSIMPCFFSYGDFSSQNGMDPSDPSIWTNNPYQTILDNPCDFFKVKEARRVTMQLIRYIVSRWGYATNVVAWEFWNEVDHMFYMCDGYKHLEQDVLSWHQEMTGLIKRTDPFHHCITTSMGSVGQYPGLYSILFDDLDFVQQHNYQSIQNAESRKQFSYILLNKTIVGHSQYPSKPFFMGEFGFDQSFPPLYTSKDPYGIDLHNSLWSSLFSTALGPASFWWWPYLINSKGLFRRYMPMLHFCENLPILSESFTAHQTGEIIGNSLVFNNNIETYYMINSTEDTIYGWCQDTAFAYQSLRWLTDGVHWVSTSWGPSLQFDKNVVFDPLGYVYKLSLSKRPSPSSNSNEIVIPITNQRVGCRYLVTWYDTESGYAYNWSSYTYVQLDLNGQKYISIQFPSQIRDLQQSTINDTFGDVAFSLIFCDNYSIGDE